MMTKKKYHGIIIPAVTPLTANYRLDEAAVEKMFSKFYSNNAQPFILGTTGESASLPATVKKEYIKAAVKYKRPGTVLYAGISANCLQESVDFANECFDTGIDVVAATLPSYYALNESQVKTYFETLANQITAPLIIYNIPATTHMSIPLQVIDDLSHHDNIVGTKDSERSDERLSESLQRWKHRADFSHFLGWAAKSAYALLNGSDGLIPSTGNLCASIYSTMQKAVTACDADKAYEMQRLSDVLGSLYQSGRTLGESLWALKVLMNSNEICETVVMPPLQPGSNDEAVRLIADLKLIIKQEGIEL